MPRLRLIYRHLYIIYIYSMHVYIYIRFIYIYILVYTYIFLPEFVQREDLHTEKYFRNLIKSTMNQIVFTIFRLIWIQTDVHLDPNQSEYGKYNLNLV